MGQANRWILPAAAVLLLGCQPLLAEESESPPSDAVGAHVFTFTPGWNLISFPLIDENDTFVELFYGHLDGTGTSENSDLIRGINPETGLMDSLWFEEGMVPHGGLALHPPSPGAAYWLYRNPMFEENARLVVMGQPRTEPSLDRGTFEPGTHLVGTFYADVIPFSESGLAEAGIEPSPGILGPEGDGVEAVLGWDTIEQRYRMAYFDGEQWRGDLPAMLPGHGYLLWNRHLIDWDQFADPTHVHQVATTPEPFSLPPVNRVHSIEGRGQ
ncbi:hypothetical protein KQI63_14210 [bacterium]|nr:hypothetical protein [bacterium]